MFVNCSHFAIRLYHIRITIVVEYYILLFFCRMVSVFVHQLAFHSFNSPESLVKSVIYILHMCVNWLFVSVFYVR